MSLTRRALKAMGIDEEKIDEIISMHSETVDGLKSDLNKYTADAEKLPSVQKELDDLKAAGDGGFISIHAPLAGRDSKHVQKSTHMFVTADKNAGKTTEKRCLQRRLYQFVPLKSSKSKCEPLGKSLRTCASH